MSAPATVADLAGLLERRADPATAEAWDRVGLVSGDPSGHAGRVLFAVDPVPAVVAEAVAGGFDLLVTHHPLLLRGVHSIAETSSRGRSLAALVRAGCALLTMHTNADSAAGGVNDALADAIGMRPQRRPIRPLPAEPTARIVVHVPDVDADRVIEALAAAGAGQLGDYDACAFWVDGTGQFRPLAGSQPHIGAVGVLERVAERRVEMVLPRSRTGAVVAALRAAHPYEEPAFSIVESVALPTQTGIGRIGDLEPTSLGDLARRLAAVLPPNRSGVRVAGDPERVVGTVAVCGGAGDSLLADVAAAGVDAYVTADLRHHPVTDFRSDSDTAIIDIPHASGEALWLRAWADRLVADAAGAGLGVTAAVSTQNTDPWTLHVPGREE